MHVASCSKTLLPQFESNFISKEMELSKNLYLAWIRDMRVVHPVASWCWRKLRVIYAGHSLAYP
jgi:hypothetical protein